MFHKFITKFLFVITLLFVGVHSLSYELERYRNFLVATFDFYDDDCYSMSYDFIKKGVLRSVFSASKHNCERAFRGWDAIDHINCGLDLYNAFMNVNKKNHSLCVYYGDAKLICNRNGKMNKCNTLMLD